MREAYEEFLARPGTPLRIEDAARFYAHRADCEICKQSEYAYQGCKEGLQLAQKMFRIEPGRLRG